MRLGIMATQASPGLPTSYWLRNTNNPTPTASAIRPDLRSSFGGFGIDFSNNSGGKGCPFSMARRIVSGRRKGSPCPPNYWRNQFRGQGLPFLDGETDCLVAEFFFLQFRER